MVHARERKNFARVNQRRGVNDGEPAQTKSVGKQQLIAKISLFGNPTTQ